MGYKYYIQQAVVNKYNIYLVKADPLMPVYLSLARAHLQLPYAVVASFYLRPNLYNRCHISKTTKSNPPSFPMPLLCSTAVGPSLLSGDFLINMINKMAGSTP